MAEIPQRMSLVGQVAEIVRRDLQQGLWRDNLPGEQTLCERLQVSRPTLRAALDVLQREGWFAVSQGKRRRILPPEIRPDAVRGSKVVRLLAGLPYHRLSPFVLFLISELQTALNDVGYRLEVHADSRFASVLPSKQLQKLILYTRADCWVVLGCPAATQEWLANQKVRVLIVGYCPKGIRLPSLSDDIEGVSRHAVGVFLQRGHSRIALVLPYIKLSGDYPVERGFRQGISLGRQKPDRVRIVSHGDSVPSIRAALTNLFRSKQPPTALLVARPKHVLTVMTHLMRSGIRIPEDVSLISAAYDPSLDYLTPSVAHYEIDSNDFARRLIRMALKLAVEGGLSDRPVRVMAELHTGESLQTLSRPVAPVRTN